MTSWSNDINGMGPGNLSSSFYVRKNSGQLKGRMQWLNLVGSLLMLCISFGFATATVAAEITVSVDRNPVSLNESFKIYFTATDTPDSDPDFNPLAQDFSVINQSQSTSSSWVNGSYTKSIRWTVEVTANRSGQLIIPAIAFGNDMTKPLAIVANQNSTDDNSAHTNEEIFLEAKAAPEAPYVQSQVIYTVRLYRRVDVAQAELSEPELADAVIEKLGEDSNYNTVVNGISYWVTERKYAIFPQKSGTLTIKPLTLTAAVIVNSQPDFRDFFSSRMTKTKRVLSNEVVLNVNPKPARFTAKDWLAAEKIELTQEWSGDTQNMKIGEPLTRTLTLKGVGTTVGQLPELNAIKTDGNIKAYPDQPVLNEQKLPEGISASRQEKIALIPSSPGKHVLPAIEIPWFNTKSQKMEIASIPETTLIVSGAVGNQQPAPAIAKPAIAPAVPDLAPRKPNPDLAPIPEEKQKFWPWLSLSLALGWLLNVLYFMRQKRKGQREDHELTAQLKQDVDLKQSVKTLLEACAKNDAQAAKNALVAWGLQKYKANNLAAIAECCGPPLRGEIIELSKVVYGRGASEWSGQALKQAFIDDDLKSKAPKQESLILEPLHRL